MYTDIKNVFINNEGINFYNKGRLASIINLEEDLGLGMCPIEGILQLEDGVYKFISREQQIEILKRDEDVTEEELDECEGEYVKINDDIDKRKYKHQNKERLCYCCDTLQESESNLHKLGINDYDRGYGSDFDNLNVKIQLCNKCYKEEYEKWFNEIPLIIDYCEEYDNEDNITKLIDSFPLENQEYVWNHMDGDCMDRQDWIDMKKGILSDEVYREYGMFTPSEIKKYEEKQNKGIMIC